MSYNSAGSTFNSNDRFSSNPLNVSLPRSRFDRSNSSGRDIVVGKLCPFYLDEVLPGDTFDVKMNYILRGVTPLYPVMDNAVVDTFFFFVPNRLVWDNWQKFNGENDNPWVSGETELTIPSLRNVGLFNAGPSAVNLNLMSYFKPDSLGSYFELPSLSFGASGNIPSASANNDLLPDVSMLPFRAYAKIWNDWFRDQNTQGIINFSKGDTAPRLQFNSSGSATGLDQIVGYILINQNTFLNVPTTNSRINDYWYDLVQYGLALAPVNKLQDYFTSSLPSPQKGDPVTLPIDIAGIANLKLRSVSGANFGVLKSESSGPIQLFDGNTIGNSNRALESTSGQFKNILYGYDTTTSGSVPSLKLGNNDVATIPTNGLNPQLSGYINGSDLSGVSVNINQLRQAVALQQALEKDARGGTRYIEIIRSHFGVISPDARLQRSEYLGGSRTIINNNQVLQTSSTDSTSPLGQTGAYSITNDSASFVKSFTEHGYIIGLMCIRVQQSYSQGIERLWTRKRRFDFYLPTFANIGETPVRVSEIYTNLTSDTFQDLETSNYNNVFGYQEAWAEYRYKPNRMAGYMKPITFNFGNANSTQKSANSLFRWTYTTNFANAPLLSNQFQQENAANVNQTLAITNLPFQFFANFYIQNYTTRVMPTYSIPGLERM